MNARTLAILCLALPLSPALSACGEKKDDTSAPAQRDVRLILDYLPNADHAGIYLAQESGEFARAGLRVKIATPSDPAAPLKLLAGGRADLAISYEPEVLLGRAAVPTVLPFSEVGETGFPLTSLMSVRGRVARAPTLRTSAPPARPSRTSGS